MEKKIQFREVPQFVKKYDHALQIAPREFKAYTQYERNHTVGRISVICINSKNQFVPEILL